MSAVAAGAPVAARTRSRAWVVILLCWLIVVLDGYDLIVYGTTLAHVMAEPGWGLDPASAGFLGSLVFVGALFGSLGAGDIADRLGRRGTILACTLLFTVCTAAIGLAPNREVFGVLRLLAGIGLGGLIPSANAMTAEFVSVRHRSAVSTIMMSGVPIGGTTAALLGLVMLPQPGWRSMYLLAGVGLVLVAVIWFIMPESPTWLHSRGRHEEARAVASRWGISDLVESARRPLADTEVATPAEASGESLSPRPRGLAALASRENRAPAILFSLASITTLFTWYGLGTWLPKLMGSDAHFASLMANPLVFLVSLNIGAVIGSIVTAWAGIRFGPLPSAIVASVLAAAGLAFLLTQPGDAAAVNMALVFAGIGTHGTQCLVLAAIANSFRDELRGTALGFASGMGRIGAIAAPQLGGLLLASSAGVAGNFVMFASAAALSALVLLLTALTLGKGRRHPHESPAARSRR